MPRGLCPWGVLVSLCSSARARAGGEQRTENREQGKSEERGTVMKISKPWRRAGATADVAGGRGSLSGAAARIGGAFLCAGMVLLEAWAMTACEPPEPPGLEDPGTEDPGDTDPGALPAVDPDDPRLPAPLPDDPEHENLPGDQTTKRY